LSFPLRRISLSSSSALRGIVRVLTSRDVPSNGFGIYPTIKDQPVLAEGEARFRGEAVAAVIGSREAIDALDPGEFPVTWEELPAVMGLDGAMAPGAHLVQPEKPGNLLLDGGVRKGDSAAAWKACAAIAEDTFETRFVSTPTSSPRRDGPGASANGWKFMSARRPRTWIATKSRS
jgi:CO/xanthine dehydrogenase Mo-binding subunit